MSTERVNRNFQKFLQTIYHWPTETIEKSILIEKLEELCRQNPELEHIYENIPIGLVNNPTFNHNTAGPSPLETTENYLYPISTSNDITQSNSNNHLSIINESPTARKESILLQNVILVKEGDLTVKKGSAVLSPILKKNRVKSSVYCELTCTFSESRKLVNLTVYQSRRLRKILYNFLMDNTCSFVLEGKRAFNFKHDSTVEKFTTETGLADSWIISFDDVTMSRQNLEKSTEGDYENPADLLTISESSSFESIRDTPVRPPPRPPLPTNPISPENIYVCLYHHRPLTNVSNELEFNCGDLLYIIDTDGPDFYVGHRLILPLNNHTHNPNGLVFKDYITRAYEKVL